MKYVKNAICLIMILALTACAKEGDFNPHLNNPQNALAYLSPQDSSKQILTSSESKTRFQSYLNHYYSSWTGQNQFLTVDQIKNFTFENIQQFSADPGWNENRHKHDKQWINSIIANMDMNIFPNANILAITITPTNMRLFPTFIPSFSSLDDPGNFYPFDNFQESYVPANLPVLIIQQSKDLAWDLVETNNDFGWIQANTLAITDKNFRDQWQHNLGYVEFKNDATPIIDEHHVFQFMSHMGSIYPIVKAVNQQKVINIAIKDENGHAEVVSVIVKDSQVYQIPLIATAKNIAIIANQFLGMPYGWGGIYGYRDCSATTMDIMSYFGVWLPRNSSKQASLGGTFFNLAGLSNYTKEQLLKDKAIPYFTLIHLPGHIVLYLGEKNGKIYILQDMWGLRTYRLFESEGRAVVGGTVITPVNFGAGYLNVVNNDLTNAVGFTVLR